jgi:branched-subunit amino acid transport protein AzlD
MGLDTDDIVSIPIFCVSAAIFAMFVIFCFIQRSVVIHAHAVEKLLTKRESIYYDKNARKHKKSMLWVVIGDQKFLRYIKLLKAKNGGELPPSSEIEEIMSPLMIHQMITSDIHPDKLN